MMICKDDEVQFLTPRGKWKRVVKGVVRIDNGGQGFILVPYNDIKKGKGKVWEKEMKKRNPFILPIYFTGKLQEHCDNLAEVMVSDCIRHCMGVKEDIIIMLSYFEKGKKTITFIDIKKCSTINAGAN